MAGVVHQAEAPRLAGVHLPAGEDEVESVGHADQARQALGAAEAGEEAELHLGEAELRLRVLGRDAALAGQGELEATAEAGAMDRGDGGERQGDEALHQLVAAPQHGVDVRRVDQRQQLLEIGPGHEAVGLAGVEDEPLRALALDAVDLGFEPLEEAGREGVDLLSGIVQAQPGDPILEGQGARVGGFLHAGVGFDDAHGRHRRDFCRSVSRKKARCSNDLCLRK